MNFCDREEFLRDGLDAERFFKIVFRGRTFDDLPFDNETPPFKTKSLEVGLGSMFSYRHGSIGPELQLKGHPCLVMVHSPYEFPNRDSPKFYLSQPDLRLMLVTAQLTKIDDTLVGMEPHE